MTTIRELEVMECEKQIFYNLVAFSKEISNPMLMKKEMDKLIERLGKHGYKHCHKVITKVLERNEEKKSIILKIMVPILDGNGINSFLETYDQYMFMKEYILEKSVKVSIPNDMNEFKKAVGKFVEYARVLNVYELDLKKNHIIEIAKVDMNGTVIGFDLHMEKVNREEE